MRADLRLALATAAAVSLLAGCTPGLAPAPTGPSASPARRVFTVVTTGPVTSADPAVATGATDAILANSIYQRLMRVVPPGELKPDLATDCLFSAELVYECTLPEGLTFHNGSPIDATDVKFSLQRALRLNQPGTSIGLLSALKRIDTPNPRTVRFHLAWADNQFGYALAGQAAAIVDNQTFNPDEPLPLAALPVGSGPLQVTSIEPGLVQLARFAGYVGPTAALLPALNLAVVPGSAEAENLITKGAADVVWGSLDAAALARLTNQINASPDRTTDSGFRRLALPGMRVHRLAWDPASKLRRNAALRLGVSRALQSDRTLSSIVPVGVPDHVDAFPIGGRPALPKLKGERVHLTLGYRSASPGHGDLARLLRDRIEGLGRVSVRVVPDAPADLQLTDAPAWVNVAGGWLQPYLAQPLAGSADKLATLDRRARSTTGEAHRAALAELQQQAAADATWLPVDQEEATLFLGRFVTTVGELFGSGQALGLWSLTNG